MVWWNGCQRISSKVLLRAAVTDMKAKADMLGMLHSNGYHSCPYCICSGKLHIQDRKGAAASQRGTKVQERHWRVHVHNYSSAPSESQVNFVLFPVIAGDRLFTVLHDIPFYFSFQ